VSRGIGDTQREIVAILGYLWSKKYRMQFADICTCYLIHADAEEGDTLDPSFERGLRRSLASLIKRGDVLVVGGGYSSKYPREFMSVTDFAKLNSRDGKKVNSVAEAKRVAAGAGRFVAEIVAAARFVAAARSRRAAARR
jgi:hypothetical protein